MIVKSAIASLKAEIKTLSEQQRADKKKLRQLHPEPASYFDVTWAMQLQFDTKFRALRITAHLNLYNELRGKPYRHVPVIRYDRYYCESCVKELRTKLEKLYPDPLGEPVRDSKPMLARFCQRLLEVVTHQ